MTMKFEEAIIKHLQTEDVQIYPYSGEFDDADTMTNIIKEGKNIIFYDLVGDTWDNEFLKRVEYSLYFIGVTASSVDFYRRKTKNELLTLIENTDAKFLTYKHTSLSLPPYVKTLKKIKDEFNDIGYLVVYERTFTVEFELEGRWTSEI